MTFSFLLLTQEPGEVKDITGTFPVDLKRDRRTSFDMDFAFPERYVVGSRHCEIYAYSKCKLVHQETYPSSQ